MKYSCLLLLILFFEGNTQDTRTVTAITKDALNKQPISNVIIVHGQKEYKTNKKGYFQLQGKAGDLISMTSAEYDSSEILIPDVNGAFSVLLKPKHDKLVVGTIQEYLKDLGRQLRLPASMNQKNLLAWFTFSIDSAGSQIDYEFSDNFSKDGRKVVLKAFNKLKPGWNPEYQNIKIGMPIVINRPTKDLNLPEDVDVWLESIVINSQIISRQRTMTTRNGRPVRRN